MREISCPGRIFKFFPDIAGGQHPTAYLNEAGYSETGRIKEKKGVDDWPTTRPPFHADHVGSLLRTPPLKQARTKHAKGEIDAGALKEVEDREIEKAIRKQEEVGLNSRPTENSAAPIGISISLRLGRRRDDELDHVSNSTASSPKPSIRVTGKVGFSSHP